MSVLHGCWRVCRICTISSIKILVYNFFFPHWTTTHHSGTGLVLTLYICTVFAVIGITGLDNVEFNTYIPSIIQLFWLFCSTTAGFILQKTLLYWIFHSFSWNTSSFWNLLLLPLIQTPHKHNLTTSVITERTVSETFKDIFFSQTLVKIIIFEMPHKNMIKLQMFCKIIPTLNRIKVCF